MGYRAHHHAEMLMCPLSYAKHERIILKTNPYFNEKWLQDRIAEDPAILGLGEVLLLERERVQEKAGRLDLLLSDPEQNYRYEVELMLGATDESHIIRCIEYWDIERRRYPGYDHCAVLVAEDITSRFLNVLSLLSGTVPLVAIQLNALHVGDCILLDFVHVLDQRLLRKDDEVEVQAAKADRAYWNDRASPKAVAIMDELLIMLNERSPQAKFQLNYNRYYVGLTEGGRTRNIVHFRPKKQFTHLIAVVGEIQSWIDKFEDAGVGAGIRDDRLKVTIAPGDTQKHKKLLEELFVQVLKENME
jgi:hypothetical protein